MGEGEMSSVGGTESQPTEADQAGGAAVGVGRCRVGSRRGIAYDPFPTAPSKPDMPGFQASGFPVSSCPCRRHWESSHGLPVGGVGVSCGTTVFTDVRQESLLKL